MIVYHIKHDNVKLHYITTDGGAIEKSHDTVTKNNSVMAVSFVSNGSTYFYTTYGLLSADDCEIISETNVLSDDIAFSLVSPSSEPIEFYVEPDTIIGGQPVSGNSIQLTIYNDICLLYSNSFINGCVFHDFEKHYQYIFENFPRKVNSGINTVTHQTRGYLIDPLYTKGNVLFSKELKCYSYDTDRTRFDNKKYLRFYERLGLLVLDHKIKFNWYGVSDMVLPSLIVKFLPDLDNEGNRSKAFFTNKILNSLYINKDFDYYLIPKSSSGYKEIKNNPLPVFCITNLGGVVDETSLTLALLLYPNIDYQKITDAIQMIGIFRESSKGT